MFSKALSSDAAVSGSRSERNVSWGWLVSQRSSVTKFCRASPFGRTVVGDRVRSIWPPRPSTVFQWVAEADKRVGFMWSSY